MRRIDFYAPDGPVGDKYGYALLDELGGCKMYDMDDRYEMDGLYRMDGEQVWQGYLIREGVAYAPMPLVPTMFFYDNLFTNQFL